MKLLVIGSGMMGSAAAYDMARQEHVESVTLADSDLKRAKDVAARVNRITAGKKVRAVGLDASKEKEAASAPAHERGGSNGNCRGRCGVLRDEAEWGLECEGEADSRVETATIGMAEGVSDRGECRRLC